VESQRACRKVTVNNRRKERNPALLAEVRNPGMASGMPLVGGKQKKTVVSGLYVRNPYNLV